MISVQQSHRILPVLPSQAVSLGDVVKVKVLTVDVKKKRIGLTMKFKE